MPVRKKGVRRHNTPSSKAAIFSSSRLRKIRGILLRWGKKNFKTFPWRDPAEPWHGLLAEILLQRTRANSAVKVYEDFVSAFETPAQLAQAPLKRIERMLYPLGLLWRAPLIKKLAKELLRHDSSPPDSMKQLTALSGVGPYAASAYLSFHGGKRAVIVDANVVRWICRMIGYAYDGETRRKKWLIQIANELTPQRSWKQFNYAVLDFTMQVCTTSPKCQICPIGQENCVFGRLVQAERGTDEPSRRLQRSGNQGTHGGRSSRSRIEST